METTYRRFGKTRPLPSTTQLKHELRYGFYPDFRPLPQEDGDGPPEILRQAKS